MRGQDWSSPSYFDLHRRSRDRRDPARCRALLCDVEDVVGADVRHLSSGAPPPPPVAGPLHSREGEVGLLFRAIDVVVGRALMTILAAPVRRSH